MIKKFLNNVSDESLRKIQEINKELAKKSLKEQKKQIKLDSPYSNEINDSFSGYDEFYHLVSIGLKEATVTRKALIRDIDFELFITEKQCTNYELVMKGLSPYIRDSKDSYLILHHIGQKFDAPFAELTFEEHELYGNSKLLHDNKIESWRREENKEREFETERIAYWKMRAKKHYSQHCESADIDLITKHDFGKKDNLKDITDAIEKLFAECSIGDLHYISNLAQSHILTKEAGVNSIEEYIVKLRDADGGKITCPACSSDNISLNGSYHTDKEKRQKYKCKDCGKVFSAFYNTIIQGCSMTLFEWLRFIECLYNGYTIKRTALLCNLSEKTAFDNRLRLFYALSILDEQIKLQGNIALDETYIPVSYKGNRKYQREFSMPRMPRKRGKEIHKHGLSKDHACIACAIDDAGNSIAKIAGLGSPTYRKIENAVNPYIDKTKLSSLFSDMSPAIKKFAEMNGYPIKQSRLLKNRGKSKRNYETICQIQRINAYHSRLKRFLENFNGISSEYLQGYVSLFAWRDRTRNTDRIEAYNELLSVLVMPNLYKSTEQIMDEDIFRSPFEIEKRQVPIFVNSESAKKSKEIYALYAKGISVKKIAKKYKCTTQAITGRLRKVRALGMAYQTKMDIEKAEKERLPQIIEEIKLEKYRNYCDLCMTLLKEKENRSGSLDEYYKQMNCQYNLSKQTIKNRIAIAKRILNLREAFYTDRKYEYMSLKKVFEMVYGRYNELCVKIPDLAENKYYLMLQKEFCYSKNMIITIIKSMKKGIDWDAKKKIKTPVSEVLNRDRSVFIDCLKWRGTLTEFYDMASEKYALTRAEVGQIIRYNCLADPKRYQMSKID